MKNKLIGAYKIAKYMGYKKDHLVVRSILLFLKAPKKKIYNNSSVYSLTHKQAQKLKKWIEAGKKIFT